jgi:hypothetical protein
VPMFTWGLFRSNFCLPMTDRSPVSRWGFRCS